MGKRFQSVLWVAIFTLVLTLQACDMTTAPYDIYVSTSGNDRNDCRSEERACLTIQSGIDKAVTGSVVYIGAGTFSIGRTINAYGFITIQGQGEQTIINQSDSTQGALAVTDTITLTDIKIQDGRFGLAVSRNSHLIGNNINIQSSATCISNIDGGRIDLTNAFLARCDWGGDNTGVFNGDHLKIVSMRSTGLRNTGAMNLQNTDIADVAGNALLNSAPAGGRPRGRLTFTHGTIMSNSGMGLINDTTADIRSVTISSNRRGVVNNGSMTLENVEVSDNREMGVLSDHDSVLTISRSGFANNGWSGIVAGNGSTGLGARYIYIQNSTISGNSTGGITAVNTATVQLFFVTVAYNNSVGIRQTGTGTIGILNSIVALNGHNNCDTATPVLIDERSLACNNAVTNTLLLLGNAGLETGTTLIPLLDGSPAIDHAFGACPSVDQRGYARPKAGRHGGPAICDVGAYEFGSSLALEIATPNLTPPPMSGLLVLQPTVTPTPVQGMLEIVTLTPTPVEPPTFTLKKNTFCRKGPDTSFSDVTAIPAGDTVDILNVSEDGFWYFVFWQKFNEKCWVGAGTGDVNGDPTGLKVLTGPTLSAPEIAPISPTPPKCNPLIKACP